jgi:hypothetical protein
MLIKTSVLSLSLALFIGVAAAQAQSGPIVQGRHLQPTQQQVDSRVDDRARQWSRGVQSGADLETAYFPGIAVPSHSASAAPRSTPAHPIDPPDLKRQRSAEGARFINQLYEELMRWTPPGCFRPAWSSGAREPSLELGETQ